MHTGKYSNDIWEVQYPRLWEGCVGAWAPLIGPTGLTLRDWSRSNHGTITNTTSAACWSSNGGKYSLSLDGTNDYAAVGSAASINVSGPMSFSCWFKTTNYTQSQAFIASSLNGGQANYAVTFGFTDNKFELWNNASGPSITSTASISDSGWHHYTCVRSGVIGSWNLSLYIDGALDKTASSGFDPSAGVYPVSIGRFGGFGGYYALGLLDDMRLYNRPLLPSEVRLLSTRRGVAYEVAEVTPFYYASAGGSVKVPFQLLFSGAM